MQTYMNVPVPEYPGYTVDTAGVVRSNGKPLRPSQTRRGHHMVYLYRDGEKRTKYVHRLVLEAFVGPCPPGMESCHWDDDKTNNQLSNLRWGTARENTEDAIRNGRRRPLRKSDNGVKVARHVTPPPGAETWNPIAMEMTVSPDDRAPDWTGQTMAERLHLCRAMLLRHGFLTHEENAAIKGRQVKADLPIPKSSEFVSQGPDDLERHQFIA